MQLAGFLFMLLGKLIYNEVVVVKIFRLDKMIKLKAVLAARDDDSMNNSINLSK